MKAEDLSKAVGQLDEELILPVQKEREQQTMKKKNTKIIWKTVAACAACLALIAGVLTVNIGGSRPGSGSGGNDRLGSESGSHSVNGPFGAEPVYAASLATAKYPDMSPYPDEASCIGADGSYDDEKWDNMYQPWSDDRATRYANRQKLLSPDAFYQTTIQKFLSDTGSKNRVYSPVNVYLALAMIAETTDGGSRAQILNLLSSENIDKIREQANALWGANYRDDGATTSILANSLWLNENVRYKQGTLDTLARDYYASSFGGDPASPEMTADLRAWLNNQTGGLLKESVDLISLDPQTVLALCSTVYFRAKWETQFNRNNNDRKPFHSAAGDIMTEFMNATSNYGPYYWSEDYSAISLSFANSGSMWLILPDEDKTVDDILSTDDYLRMCCLPGEWENLKSMKVHYSVPKFDVSSNLDLADSLKELGVTDIFDSARSDFSPLTSDVDGAITVSEVKHAARVVIDEEGCTAAAFTEMSMTGAGMPSEEEIDFVLDRPFLFVITSDTNCPLFVGIVNQP